MTYRSVHNVSSYSTAAPDCLPGKQRQILQMRVFNPTCSHWAEGNLFDQMALYLYYYLPFPIRFSDLPAALY